LLSQILTEQGYHVRAVTSGRRALESAELTPPDLVLLDIRMPGMDGYQVCERLKADPKTCEAPILFISALDEASDKVRAFNAGGVDYITKPFQFEEVLARVQTHLALRRLQKQLQAANRKMERELAMAAEVQASLLPARLPDIPGWQMAVSLTPARETSGDFFDTIRLPGGKLGIVIADVVDKGVGAAMFMAISSTLIRTYASELPDQPGQALAAVNQRILTDSQSQQFVTVFYATLDPASGQLTYANAGHNPPAWILEHDHVESSVQYGPGEIVELRYTGIPLGVDEEATWEERSIRLHEGDLLLLYTDGLTDAENKAGEPFGAARLLATCQADRSKSAIEIKNAILEHVYDFIGECWLEDDLAVMVVKREAGSEQRSTAKHQWSTKS
jgi:sigma-B regulation protein RsbU (phosphoserine phosphatase)